MSWRIACTCGSLSGLVGAVLGGLGVGAQSARLKAEGTVAVGPDAGLPPLGETEFVVVPAIGGPSAPVQAIADTILEFGQAFHTGPPEDGVQKLHRKERSSTACGSA